MGRVKGQLNRDSRNAILVSMEIGERHYIETTLENYPSDMRIVNTPITRRPEILKGRKFSTTLFTAVSSSKAGDIRYLICLERKE